MRLLRAVALAALLLGSLCPPGAAREADAADPAAVEAAPADLELMQRILEESRVETTIRKASVSRYLAHLIEAFQAGIVDLVAGAFGRLGSVDQVLLWTGRILMGAALLAVVLGLGSLVWRLFRRRGLPPPPGSEASSFSPQPAARGAQAWRREIEEHLAGGRIPEALEAVWWWAARSLTGARADPSWTSRELTRRARRPELAPALRRLDSMIYGAEAPSVAGVRHLLTELETRVP